MIILILLATHIVNLLDTSFPGFQSEGLWRNYITSTKTSLTFYECGILCYTDSNCGYFLYLVNDCHIGNLDATSSILSPNLNDVQTAYIYNGNGTV